MWFKDALTVYGNISGNNIKTSAATRISNLNSRQAGGWYSWTSGATGAPTTYGIVFYVQWGTDSDFAQIALGTNNALYTRYYVNGGYTAWSTK